MLSGCANADPTGDTSLSTTAVSQDSTTSSEPIGTSEATSTVVTSSTVTTATTTTARQTDRGDVPAGLPITSIAIAGVPYVVALAADPDPRVQGLMGVTDLGELDGMLFEFQEESELNFWMKDTLIDLDIAFFDGSGSLVSVKTMTPCTSDPCPTYGSEIPARYAVEVPAGTFAALAAGASLTVLPD